MEKERFVSEFVERISAYSQKRLVVLAAQLNANLERIKSQASEPVAIIGMGCRFPGGAIDPESFWKLISQGRDAISEVPPDRWDLDGFYDPDPDAPGKMNTRWGGFLSEVDQFDPEFFGISPREAAGMDPQQRLLLEVVWEALENACQSPDRLAGSRTGVFVGLSSSDYLVLGSASGVGSIDAYMGTGNSHSVASGRISYLLGLQGPSISVDTACSASLVAVHLACQSLRTGECRMALAGGVNLILAPDTTVFASKARMLAPDGRCKSFDESANGYVRGEGCGIVVLKRLSDARADGDHILAVIRGTASNQDGRSSGLTAPNGPSQVAVIKEALANGDLKPDDIDLIEAHGTGTALGDPIEAGALADVFGAGRGPENPLRVGSVKTNIGHAEAAAGIAGLIKVVLALRHGKIPPSLHLRKLSPHIDWSGLAIGVPTAETTWNHPKGLRCAGVSSFGFSGTNAHVIVSDFPAETPADAAAPDPAETDALRPLHLLPLSAQTEPALAELARRYEQEFSENPGIDLADVCYTAGTARASFKHRLTVTATNIAEAKEQLAAFRRGEQNAQVQAGRASRSSAPGVVFMFTGQGSQYFGMGRELFETQPVFRAELEKSAEILKTILEKPLLDVLFSDGSLSQLLDETQYTQPALFALEYSLATLWRSWGIEPAAVLGHSVGEYVAACVAGVFSLEDGLKLIAERGRLMATLPAGGAMAAVFTDEARVAKALASYQGKAVIACLNGPDKVVISGEGAAVRATLARLKDEGIKARQLAVSHAFHSPLMDPILDSFERVAKEVRFNEPRIAIVSNVTGKIAPADMMISPGYWRRHIREPVRFVESIGTLHENGFSVFLEIGPAPVLLGMARQCTEDSALTWLFSLRKEQNAWHSMLSSLGALFLLGVNPDWRAFDRPYRRRLVTLPTYPFQRARHWLESPKPGPRRVADSATAQVFASESANWFYGLEWREQKAAQPKTKEIGFDLPADFIPTPAVLVEKAGQEHGGRAEMEKVDIYEALRPKLQALSAAFIFRALSRLGWSPQPREHFTTPELVKRLAIIPAHHRLFERMMGILAEEGILEGNGEGWRVLRSLEGQAADLQAEAAAMKQSFPECSAEITLTARCADSLAEVLNGKCSPLQLLFPGGNFDTADDLYRRSPFARALNTAARQVLAGAIMNAPKDRKIRILEIGGGTGGTTSFLLPLLPVERTHYAFTDVSTVFLARARDEFREYPFVSYKMLDIEKPPAAQGFNRQVFDVVIAANAMHATRDLRDAIKNAISLLAPGGLFILLESTVRQRWVDLTFGLTDGWWRFDDTALRPDYPLLSVDQWLALFKETGLEVVPYTPWSARNGSAVPQAVLLGQKSSAKAVVKEAAGSSGYWIILADTKGIAEKLAALISGRGAESVLVSRGAGYKFAQGGRATLNPLCPGDFSRLLSDLFASRKGLLQGVVNLWPVDEEVTDQTTLTQWKMAQAQLGGGVLHATQALVSAQTTGLSSEAKLWLVTRGAQVISSAAGNAAGGSSQPAQALVWGLARVISLEHSSRFGAIIDLDFDTDAQASAAALWEAIGNLGEEDAVAWRAGRSFVPRVVRSPEPQPAKLVLRNDASYLITGGLGGLGLHIARWLAERGAGHLLLLSRRDFPARLLWSGVSSAHPEYETIQSILATETLGARIEVVKGDVADEGAMRLLFARFGNSDSNLRGIIHAAVEAAAQAIGDMNLEAFQRMCRAKVLGAWILHQLTLDLDLDFFVLFSSVSAVWGAGGQAHYAAANQALDQLAQMRRLRGLPALSVNWGAWQDIRMASEADKKRFEKSGLHQMPNAQALAALERLITTGRPSAIVASVDWSTLCAAYEARRSRPLFAEMQFRPRIDNATAASPKAADKEPDFSRQLRTASPTRRRDILLAHLRSQVGEVLGFGPAREVELDRGLYEMGLDSLMAVELKGRLERSLGVTIATSVLIQGPTLIELGGWLLERLGAPEQAAAGKKEPALQLVQLLNPRAEGCVGHPLYFCHHIDLARILARYVLPGRPLYNVQTHYDEEFRVWQETKRLEISIAQMAERSVVSLRATQQHGPYYLAGFCFGGNLAFEIAQQLTRQGEEVALLVLLDTYYPQGFRRLSAPSLRRWVFHLRKLLRYRSAYVAAKSNNRHALKNQKLAAAQRNVTGCVEPDMSESEKIRRLHNYFMLDEVKAYKGAPYAGRAVLLRGIVDCDFNVSERYGWEQLMTGDFRVEEIICTHKQFEEAEYLRDIAKWLDLQLSAADARLLRK
jgi:acyl transferase domain-containing protein/thioesterase domain-containing protein/SAM-dependent methyltransferase/aryl carrier-like protein